MHFWVLDEIDAGEHRKPQRLRVRRVRLGEQTAFVHLVDERFLLPRREGDQVVRVARAAVLHEVRALVEIGTHGDAQLVGRQVEQFFARALRDEVHHVLVEERRRRRVGEERRLGSAPSDDVAGDQHSWTDQLSRARSSRAPR